MKAVNPLILRNYLAQQAVNAEQDNVGRLQRFASGLLRRSTMRRSRRSRRAATGLGQTSGDFLLQLR